MQPEWRGLWEWSMKHADGTGPGRFRPEDVDHDKMKWLDAALKHYMVDFASRMKDIRDKLSRDTPLGTAASSAADAGGWDAGGGGAGSGGDGGPDGGMTDLEEREALLDELMDIVGSIDYARDLHKIGGLPVLLELLASPHPSLRWRAAEVVATCVANNPPVQEVGREGAEGGGRGGVCVLARGVGAEVVATCVASNPPVQEWFLAGGVLPPLLALLDPAQPPACRTKGLLALSGLVRHFAPGLQAFREAGGLTALVGCLSCDDRRVGVKAMRLLDYVLSQRGGDCTAAAAAGALGPLAAAVSYKGEDEAEGDSGAEADEVDAEACDYRTAALGALRRLAGNPATWAAVRDKPGLRPALAALTAAGARLTGEAAEVREQELAAAAALEATLAAPSAPAAAADESDHVSLADFEAAGGGQQRITINDPPAAQLSTANDVAAAAADQGAPAAAAPAAAAAGGSEGQGPAAAPLMLGPP
ncbi:hypothetical protein HYH03_017299 [Edaphochlamys debaryana]|uniref:Uncharacterized protein n=1 Tax=Edaphochlamys debaryana TaxID=47281 RepID=A0A835XPJ9_9CHLO|nr:hypothetical protein HYH03_017299 [Edaphochlamys debaryana]|eukprot:KAG2483844.1 hypothetical protein HYH03_017299 [Edaphochlamys debaryana]